MKRITTTWFFLFIVLLGFTDCKKECCVNLQESIIGTWDFTLSRIEGVVEFRNAGVLIDTENVLLGREYQGVPLQNKTWELIEDDTKLFVVAFTDTSSVDFTFEVVNFECDRMEYRYLDNLAELTRRN